LGRFGARGPPNKLVERSLSLDVLDAKFVGPARQEFIELRLSGPDNFVLQHLYQPVN
jgi:hypothetical protein